MVRHLVLPPELEAPRRARQMVREVLGETLHVEWLDAAELAVSELVTNAALHAGTSVEVSIEVRVEQVQVRVRDFNPAMPKQRHYGERATTGRGMALVAAISSTCGVTPLPDGKVAWFALRAQDDEPAEADLLAAWGDEQWDLPAPSVVRSRPQEVRGVDLLALPPMLWLAAREHHDALLRELTLYVAHHDPPDVDFAGTNLARQLVSDAVLEVIDDIQRDRAAGPAGEPGSLPEQLASLDLHLDLPPEAGPATAALQDTLDTAERLARRGQLLAFPGQPEIIALRDWLCEQVQSQLQGEPPHPWPGGAHRHAEAVGAWEADTDLAAALDFVLESPRGVVAADESNRIVAVSRGLATALGWTVEDLLGRRIVSTLVPKALRDAHIAGFSRHLTTGEARVMGRQLTVPVLCADGQEVTCTFLLEQGAAPAGRSLYLAWIDPVDEG